MEGEDAPFALDFADDGRRVDDVEARAREAEGVDGEVWVRVSVVVYVCVSLACFPCFIREFLQRGLYT